MYKNDTIKLTNSQPINYIDPNINTSLPTTYSVETHLNAVGRARFQDWGDNPSKRAIYSTVVASDNVQSRVAIKWGKLSTVTDHIKLYRNDEEIVVLDSTATTYFDAEGVPGKKYKYTLEALKEAQTVFTATDSGYTKAIGKIYGNVKTKQGSGVAGVVLTATSLVEGILHTDTVHTDATGYYQLNALYFGADNAKFTITPSFRDHKFNAASQSRTLDISLPTASGVDFTDTTALTVKGMVQFSAMPVYT
ncbi:MAG: carboxypeptidase regulatory-like domain-containing protein, partial [Rickettsiales bacterium]